jgi:hypothetical protein
MKKRPLLVWLIFIIYLVGTTFAVYSFLQIWILAFNGFIPFNIVFVRLNNFDLIAFIGGTFLQLSAAISLVMLKRISLILFLASYTLDIVSYLVQVSRAQGMETLNAAALSGTIVSWVVMATILFYVRSLIKNKILI